ncbi:anthranilate synthase component I family protein [Leucobacter komagatae]|uniref:anthranilate synthase component I family protein n=1 Tax=Leucobacter komagatae TaxID=55969 RepID=UPI001E2C894F|nr:anthranilate synthase component I family protein [Leucobacter komagatae]
MEIGGLDVNALDVARALSRTGAPWFWLDGEAAAPGEQRVSYLGVASEVREAIAGEEKAFLAALRSGHARPAEQGRGFSSGWIVALGYEFGVALLGIDPDPDDAAAAFALRVDAVLALDHVSGAASISGDPAAVRQLCELLAPESSVAAVAPAISAAASTAGAATEPAWRSADYGGAVEECRSAIRRGDAYVLCLTDSAEAETARTPLELYERLRGGAMRGGVIALPDRALVSASPERFLSVRALPDEAGFTVATHPIKGTRPRGETPERDAELARELAADPKERAENLMIVDLMRNDLSRVCAPGSVRVERFLEVETHPRVHQLVSTVTGQLESGRDVYDAIEYCFPGGSMTGAPKRSAVEILAGLEAGPRGLYSGCFGWIDDSGDAELAMTIRGVELRGELPQADALRAPDAVRALVGAGGGITIDSDPAAERRERDLKAAAMLAIL